MHDILADLRERVYLIEQELTTENARYEHVVAELKAKHEASLQHLRAQLLLANKLIDFTAWHHNVRTVLTAHIAAAEAAENSIAESMRAGAEPVHTS